MLARPATLREHDSSVGEQGRHDGYAEGGGDSREGVDSDAESLEICHVGQRVSSGLVNVGVQVEGSVHQDCGEGPGQDEKRKVKDEDPY